MKSYSWIFTYIFISAAAMGSAFYLSSAFMAEGNAAENEMAAENEAQAQVPTPAPAPDPVPVPVPEEAATPVPPTPGGPVPPGGMAPPDALLEESEAPTQQTAVLAPTGDGFILDTNGLRDPFRPYKTLVPAGEGKEEVFDPLQNLDLDTLELVAVVWDVNNPRALVKTKAGATYTLQRNTKVGRNNGVVAAIREGEVVVLETYEEDGRTFKQYSSIKMSTIGSNLPKTAK